MPGLKVLVDRRTVVEDDAVRRLVGACETAATRLERQVLDDAAPLPPLLRVLDALGRALACQAARVIAVVAGAAVVGLVGGLLLTGPGPLSTWRGAWPARWLARGTTVSTTPLPLGEARAGLGPPRIDVAGSATHGYQIVTRGVADDLLAIELRDEPDEVEALRPRDDGGAPAVTTHGVEAPIVATAQLVGRGRTVLPRSQILWPARAAVAGVPWPIVVGADDLPVVELSADGAVVDVFAALTPPPPPRPVPPTTTRPVPPSLVEIVAAAGGDRSLRGVQAIGDAVSAAIRWAADAEAARRFDADPRGVVDKALALGVGDCDVMNAIYVRALQAAGFRARLARGLVVRRDVIATDLHAWGEVWVDGDWHLVDASPRSAIPVPAAPGAAGTGSTTSSATMNATPLPTPAPPTTAAPSTAPATTSPSHEAVVVGVAAGAGLILGLGGGLFWWRRRRLQRQRRDDRIDDVIPLLGLSCRRPMA
jgi:hypothetical protein